MRSSNILDMQQYDHEAMWTCLMAFFDNGQLRKNIDPGCSLTCIFDKYVTPLEIMVGMVADSNVVTLPTTLSFKIDTCGCVCATEELLIEICGQDTGDSPSMQCNCFEHFSVVREEARVHQDQVYCQAPRVSVL